MGGDRGILIKTENDQVEPLSVAKIIKYICDKEKPDLIILESKLLMMIAIKLDKW